MTPVANYRWSIANHHEIKYCFQAMVCNHIRDFSIPIHGHRLTEPKMNHPSESETILQSNCDGSWRRILKVSDSKTTTDSKATELTNQEQQYSLSPPRLNTGGQLTDSQDRIPAKHHVQPMRQRKRRCTVRSKPRNGPGRNQ